MYKVAVCVTAVFQEPATKVKFTDLKRSECRRETPIDQGHKQAHRAVLASVFMSKGNQTPNVTFT